MWKDFINDYLYFTGKERQGIVLIVSIILISIIFPICFPYFTEKASYKHEEFENEIARLKILKKDASQQKNFPDKYSNEFENDYSMFPGKRSEIIPKEVFYFDPNTASIIDWKRLGLKDKTIKTIQNYIAKGGKFYKREDIRKIWGLAHSDAQRLIPYVKIESPLAERNSFEKKDYPKTSSPYSPKITKPIDVNLADTIDYV
ncbi:MAG: helix-hairpin-helix domain-containing protein, partial [Ginsengibacter sp.]